MNVPSMRGAWGRRVTAFGIGLALGGWQPLGGLLEFNATPEAPSAHAPAPMAGAGSEPASAAAPEFAPVKVGLPPWREVLAQMQTQAEAMGGGAATWQVDLQPKGTDERDDSPGVQVDVEWPGDAQALAAWWLRVATQYPAVRWESARREGAAGSRWRVGLRVPIGVAESTPPSVDEAAAAPAAALARCPSLSRSPGELQFQAQRWGVWQGGCPEAPAWEVRRLAPLPRAQP